MVMRASSDQDAIRGVVAIGASAGGVEALPTAVAGLSPEFPYPYLGPMTTRSRVHCGPRSAACRRRPSYPDSWPIGRATVPCFAATPRWPGNPSGPWQSRASDWPPASRAPEMSVTDVSAPVRIHVERENEAVVLVADGVLDSSTYQGLRDAVIKAALDEPRAVLVDVNRLTVPSPSAWSVFTSARWHVSTWPDVPILLACRDQERIRAIAAHGVTRYVQVYPTRRAALAAAEKLVQNGRRRARAELPQSEASLRIARKIMREWLTAWSADGLIPLASTIATVFIENVLAHTDSAPVLMVEKHRDTITIAVQDNSQQPAARHEDAVRGAEIVSGLGIVAVLSRSWGSTPTSSGKTVWALVGAENQL